MTEIHSFGIEPITCHSFNSDRTRLAISPNSNEVHIHERKGNKWVLESVLNQHDLRVSSIDWSAVTNRIVTCSADRNAYVWSEVDGTWKPTLVLLRIHRAATCVRWSPKGDKFAVGSGAKLISVCYFEEANDWWISKHIKKQIKSTVTSLDWHPNNSLLACGSTDYKARIYSAYIKEVDKGEPEKTLWGGKMSSGSLIAEFSSCSGSSWIHDVSFSPDGNRLAWVSHDSSISVADATKNMTVVTHKTRFLPYLTCVWSTVKFIVAAGHDCYPALYQYDEGSGKLDYVDKIDKSEKKETDGFSAMRKFRDMDKLGINDISNGQNNSDSLDTIHQNTIVELRVYSSSKGVTEKLSTVSLDGKMVIWDLGKSLTKSLSGLKLNSN
ncbi:Actin-related protein 2/3 complex subunit 1A [Halotydeus destructor]|nr:Actin-related protein 2/3 complex subunit 1A [Halotydeus destructor]